MTTKNQKQKKKEGLDFRHWVNIDEEIWATTKSGAVQCCAVCRLTFVGGGPLDQSVSQAEKRNGKGREWKREKEEGEKAMKRMCAVH